MSAEAVASLIKTDVTAKYTAAQVLARSTNSGITDVSQIPHYLYMTLQDMLFYPATSHTPPAILANRVSVHYGDLHKPNAAGGIDIVYQSQESVSSSENKDKDDSVGAEFGVMRILCRRDPVGSSDTDLAPGHDSAWVEQMDLRIRYLIDCLWRSQWTAQRISPFNSGGVGGAIDPTGLDYTLDPEVGVLCRWKQFDDPSAYADDVRAKSSIYSINFKRLLV